MAWPTEAEIDAARSTKSGFWTQEQLAEWGIPWPPPKGWRKMLLAGITIDQAMEFVRPEHRYNLWCEAELCWCMGCCNRTVLEPNPPGRTLETMGFTKADWESWLSRQPKEE